MSGHSKWAQIKHKKAAADAKRGNLFSKLARAITVAAKESGGGPETSAKLRLAIERAQSLNMPADNIERAIARATSQKEAGDLFSVTYEVYGPGGSAIIVEGITDNKNRTAAEIKHTLAANGGKLGGEGAVGWMFARKGAIILERRENPELNEPDIELQLIDGGAEEIDWADDAVTVFTPPDKRPGLASALQSLGFKISENADVLVPKSEIFLANEAEKLAAAKLIDALENHDDVHQVWSNIKNL